MTFVEFVWLLLIFIGIGLCLMVLWAETINAWYEWREDRESHRER